MKCSFFMLFCIVSISFADVSHAQEKLLNINSTNKSVREVLSEIEKGSNVVFFYNNEQVDVNRRITVNAENLTVTDILHQMFKNSDVAYELMDNNIIVLYNKNTETGKNTIAKQQSPQQQGLTIKGQVVDSTGEPIIGASILQKGTPNGTITDLNGNFHLNVPLNAILTISYIGYLPQEIKVTRASISIRLLEDIKILDEVVVIGYGVQKRSEVTAAVASLKEDAFNTTAAPTSVLELAKGKMAGVTITSPNGTDPRADTEIQIRGISSLTGGTSPLIVIDGVPGGDLSLVQAEDVESFDVLKDASAAAIYGTRGANGVVLITTKKARRGEQKTTVEYSGYISHDYVYRSPEVLSAKEYRNYMSSNKFNSNLMTDYGANTDWIGELLDKDNLSYSHNIAVSGGNKNSSYRASAFYKEINPIAIESEQKSWGARFNSTQMAFNDKLSLQLGISANFRKRNLVGSNSAFEQASQRNPTLAIKDEDGKWIDDQGAFDSYNPLADYAGREDYANRTTLLLSGKATYTILDGLTLSTMASWQQYDDLRRQYYTSGSKYSRDFFDGAGRAEKWDQQNITKTIETTLEYTKTFKNIHSINAIIGHSYQYHVEEGFDAWNSGFASDAFLYNNLGLGVGLTKGASYGNMDSSKKDNKLAAIFGRVNYVLMGKYQFSATLRHEGSSRFGKNNRWGNFPAISTGWIISQEKFMKNLKFINNLKIRAGYGVTGNQDIGDYQYMATFTSAGVYPIEGSSWYQSYGPSRNPNPDLKWEKKQEFNIGIDFSILSNRLNGTFDIYNRKTKDLLYTYNTQNPPFVLSTIYTNVGDMTNKGFEIGLQGLAIKTKDFTWDVNATFSHQKNKLNSLSNPLYKASYKEDYEFTGVGQLGYAIRTQEGGPVGEFYGFRYAGLDENGEWLFFNKNGEAVNYRQIKTEDKTWIGNGTPKFYASLGNTFKYKGFDLTIFFRGKFGFDILNTKNMYFGNLSWLPKNVLKVATTDNANIRASMQFSDYYIEKGDFVKLDNITLGYTVKLPENKYISRMRMYLSAQNLATFTGYSGTTPEVHDAGLSPGIEERTFYPTTTTIMFGLNLGF